MKRSVTTTKKEESINDSLTLTKFFKTTGCHLENDRDHHWKEQQKSHSAVSHSLSWLENSRSFKQCDETLKALTAHVRSKGDFGKGAIHIEHRVEKPEDPDLDKPTDLSENNANVKRIII